jgi:hypothetical protein
MKKLSGVQVIGLIWLVLGFSLEGSRDWLNILLGTSSIAVLWLGAVIGVGLVGFGFGFVRQSRWILNAMALWLAVSFVLALITSATILFNNANAGVPLAAPYLVVAGSSLWDAIAHAGTFAAISRFRRRVRVRAT